jgi:molybdopterin-guanine dinucleotide biosynthesis protein A
MRAASGNYVFVVACDMPFLQPDVIDLLFKEAVGRMVASCSRHGEMAEKEPLHAVYNREQLITVVERSILMDDHRVMAAVSQLHDIRIHIVDYDQAHRQGNLCPLPNQYAD